MKSSVERWLPTTRLAERKIDGKAQAMQQTNRGLPGFRVEYITQAGDEQSHP
jgi:hypothetical protein